MIKNCSKKFFLHKGKCSLCGVEFGPNTDGSNTTTPSIRNPVWVCQGQVQYSCTEFICNKCFQKERKKELARIEKQPKQQPKQRQSNRRKKTT